VVVQFGEGLLLVYAELASLLAFHEAVQGLGYLHLDVEGLVLFKEPTQELELSFDLFHLCEKFLRQFAISLSIFNSRRQIHNF